MSTKCPSVLLCDFYKVCHSLMLPKNITRSVSYFTPRSSRVEQWDKIVMFGLQGFIKDYLIEDFNEHFFNRPLDEVMNEIHHILDNTFGASNYSDEKFRALHNLGYLPIEIFALPEGTLVPVHVPMFGIVNTHENFAWLPQALESLISTSVWLPMITATVGYTYRQIVNEWYDKTCDDNVPRARAAGNFDYRGDDSNETAMVVGASWLLSFLNTATVPAIPYLEQHYNCDCEKEPVGFGSPSSEHSCMCARYAADGDQITLLRDLLVNIFPNSNFSAVLDSYDYWDVIENILPQLKNEILNHNGVFFVRGDSGHPVDTLCETVFKLWDIFGGTINSKGYKVLDPHIRALYGDSITIQYMREIYEKLESKGFAANNVSLGVGSFSMRCIMENNELKPFTRDTFSFAIKAVYCELDGKPTPIFKNPKESTFKKSQKGCCVVSVDENGEYYYKDGITFNVAHRLCDTTNELKPIFRDGKMLVETSLAEIRERLHKGEF